ncbi:uncharacterized protein LOC105804615 [Gossypium raimondii]|uniref:Ankyrin repeat domain-containing protein n=1 Tax=Gossypium raimondii TaxID=29730 RepID=A0A0D2PFK6_GOSRA|nr:uncharacterized protein LOC105804615 [Gossypium raimondii]KJB44827.1 hypothetical protein B456_007G275300 [Gossypium raimondii]KJB44828.1 hypothetical protein B456_007G275300 [Gossypium raimondii]KJB44829.1 hypothetical protein B456_007G275300 [Gossypium raimondii]
MEDPSKYAHSPAHLAVARRDHAALRCIISTLPRLAKAGEVNTEAESLEAEERADALSAVLDRRDVPGRETPLHLAVRLRDPISVEILMLAGADRTLRNEQGWKALEEAVWTREEAIAMIFARHSEPLAWARWCRRLPRFIASLARIRDFYMEISFHFESSVIPFIGRIAPSDTYCIWKRGSNFRADTTLAGFDGFHIKRSHKTVLFLGEGYTSEDDNLSLPAGSLIVIYHKKKEVINALEGAGEQPTESEIAHEVRKMSKTNMYRPRIDVAQAELAPQLNWRRQERSEMVGNWKAKIYDMLHVTFSMKSRGVPGAMTDEERMANSGENNEYDDVLTAEERMQLNSELRKGNSDGFCDDDDDEHGFVDCQENGSFDCQENGSAGAYESVESNVVAAKEKKRWFARNKKGSKNGDNPDDSKIGKFSKSDPGGRNQKQVDNRRSASEFAKEDAIDGKKHKDKSSKKKKKGGNSDDKHGNEIKKGVRPVLWLTPDFPLKTEDLLPLFDILGKKVKPIRRLREILTTKLPPGTFPVKVAIPIVSTIRVLVTFTRFEELLPMEEFTTPPSSPVHFQDAKSKESEGSTSWTSWMRGSRGGQSSDSDSHDEVDPFHIPTNYTWIDANEQKRRMLAKKAEKARRQQQQPKVGMEARSR